MSKKIKNLVVDTGALVKNIPLWEYGEDFYCISDVIREIRDRQTRRHIDALPIVLKFREPKPSSVKFINDFTKKTGDYASLSAVDTKILALTYELEVEAKGGASHLRSTPLVQRTEQVASLRPPQSIVIEDIEGFYYPSRKKRNSTAARSASSTSDAILEEVEEEYKLDHQHLHQLNHHLSLHSYVKGYVLSAEDISVFQGLKEQFPELENVAQLADKHRCSNQWNLWKKLCLNFPQEIPSKIHYSPSNEVDSIAECDSLKVAREFYHHYRTWPHFCRWFVHLLAFEDSELQNIAAESSPQCCVSLKEVFMNISNLNDGKTYSAEGDSKCVKALADDLIGLELESSENETNSSPVELNDPNSVSSKHECEEDGECEVGDCRTVVDNEDGERKNSESEMKDNGHENAQEEFESEELLSENDENGEEDFYEYEEEEEEEKEEDSSYESDDDEGWITPANIKQKKIQQEKGVGGSEEEEEREVACITGDYAMQNTLKHIGLNVVGINGKIVTTVRTFILRCYACFKTTDKMDRVFCYYCGNKTLKRVSVTLNPDGTQKIWISTRKPLNTRGLKYPLPFPKGGKHAVNPRLVADQREPQQRVSKMSRMRNDPLNEDYDTRTAPGGTPFKMRDVYSRAAQLGIKTGKKQHRGIFYWEQRNPNEPLKKGTRKKKRL